MTAVFRRARRSLSSEGRLGRYVGYAAGEIVLVVVGILIALQINNWNTERQSRSRELIYLANIRSDLVENISEIDRIVAERVGKVASAKRILGHYDGDPVSDWSAFNADAINVFDWQRFYFGNNTYQELVSSGNFGTLSNGEIKTGLLNVEALYGKTTNEENHYRFDSETALYRPLYGLIDLNAAIADLEYRSSGGKAGKRGAATAALWAPMLRDQTLKNGFVLTILEYGKLNAQLAGIRDRCRKLIVLIDRESHRS